jgi:hypothetical protein
LDAGGDARIYLRHTAVRALTHKNNHPGTRTTGATLGLVTKRAFATPNGDIFWATTIRAVPDSIDEIGVLAIREFFLFCLSFEFFGTLG